MSIAARKPRRAWLAGGLAGGLVALAALLVALGVWQVERRAWKHALIAAVDARVHAAPVAAPGPAAWRSLSAERDAYRRVRLKGHFLQNRETLVRAVSDFGAGYWVMSPFDTGSFTVLVNRGFIAQSRRNTSPPPPAGEITVTGLLRISEPGGGFLRHNDPATDNWYSRDVAAMARARGIEAAPYFIDADAALNRRDAPVGGLTVVQFTDSHAVYALTWFAMALLSLGGAWQVVRSGRGRVEASA